MHQSEGRCSYNPNCWIYSLLFKGPWRDLGWKECWEVSSPASSSQWGHLWDQTMLLKFLSRQLVKDSSNRDFTAFLDDLLCCLPALMGIKLLLISSLSLSFLSFQPLCLILPYTNARAWIHLLDGTGRWPLGPHTAISFPDWASPSPPASSQFSYYSSAKKDFFCLSCPSTCPMRVTQSSVPADVGRRGGKKGSTERTSEIS